MMVFVHFSIFSQWACFLKEREPECFAASGKNQQGHKN